MKNKLQHGLEYEEHARIYLENSGYRILAQNVRYRFGEIDIVAESGKTLVFVEVRKKDIRPWVRPEESIGYTKTLRLKKAIQAYLVRYRGTCDEIRIDLIGIIDKKNAEGVSSGEGLRHYQNFISG